jgi:hypothetical protein
VDAHAKAEALARGPYAPQPASAEHVRACYGVAIVDAFVIMHALGLAPSFALATVVEALWCGVRFATFFIPASLGPLEGANAAAFPALGIAGSPGLAFTLVVWIGLGAAILLAMRPARAVVGPQPSPAARGGGLIT